MSVEDVTRRTDVLKPLLTLDEVAEVLRISPRTVRRFVAGHRLPCIFLGRQLRFDPADVRQFLAARRG